MKVLVFGCGNIGSVAAEDLATTVPSAEIVLGDKNEKRAREAADRMDTDKVSWTQLDVENHKKIGATLEDVDLVMGFLPGNLGYRLLEECIHAGKDLLDVSFMAENPLTLDRKARNAEVTMIPDCGLAPGISNILVGHAVGEFSKVDSVHIMVGGLPEKPMPPLNYVVTWSPDSLIDEYTREARIVQKGQKVEVETLTGLEEIDFPRLGKLEAFYTDGLRTLLHSLPHVAEMWEKTLRYPGHAEKIRLLRNLGFFAEKQIEVDGVKVSPRKLTAALLAQKLCRPHSNDVVALRVAVSGSTEGEHATLVYHMLDRYDEKRGITAMARTTAYPASIVASMMLNGKIEEKGVVTPERLGMKREFCRLFLTELIKRGIHITEQHK